jgi:precorrin-6B methylase 2
VANFILLEHVHEAQQWAKAHGLESDLVWLSAARSKRLAGMTSLEPLTPIAILSITPASLSPQTEAMSATEIAAGQL